MPLNSPRFAGNARLQQAAENSPALKAGEKGEAVVLLQLALLDLGFAMPITTAQGKKMPDGIYGQETAAIVSAFQRQNGLAADGVVGRDTLAALERRLAEVMTALATAQAAEVRRQVAVNRT